MSNVIVIFKVYAKDGMITEVADRVKALGPVDMRVEDIAFGIRIIKAAFKFNDEQTSSSKIEEQIRKLEGVSELDVDDETLI